MLLVLMNSERVFLPQNHNEALDDHKRITMDEYKKEYRKVEIRRCEKHTDHVYSVACKKCHGVFCVKCLISKSENCSNGKLPLLF